MPDQRLSTSAEQKSPEVTPGLTGTPSRCTPVHHNRAGVSSLVRDGALLGSGNREADREASRRLCVNLMLVANSISVLVVLRILAQNEVRF